MLNKQFKQAEAILLERVRESCHYVMTIELMCFDVSG